MEKTIYVEPYGALIRWLRKKRVEKGLTLRDMARDLGVHHSRIGRIETGERRLDVLEYIRFCEVLGVDPHEGIDVARKQL